MVTMTEDERLLAAMRNGSKAAFHRIYDKYAPSLYGIIDEMTGHNIKLSELVLQDCFYAIWQNTQAYAPSRQRFFTWITGIARTMAREALLEKDPGIHKAADYVGNINGTDGLMNKKSKNALDLVHFKGYSMQDAAKKLDICVQELQVRLREELNVFRKTTG